MVTKNPISVLPALERRRPYADGVQEAIEIAAAPWSSKVNVTTIWLLLGFQRNLDAEEIWKGEVSHV